MTRSVHSSLRALLLVLVPAVPACTIKDIAGEVDATVTGGASNSSTGGTQSNTTFGTNSPGGNLGTDTATTGGTASSSSTGGAAASSGTVLGGSTSTGGSVSTGGKSATGGMPSTGGTTTTGGGTSASCSGTRISESEAATLYTKYAFQVQPDLNPTTTFDAVEQSVDGLWENLYAQLFRARGYGQDGSLWRECSVVYHACQFTDPTNGCGQGEGALGSGLVMNGAFHYSWEFGSGILRSELGKLTADATGLTRTVSPAYTNSTSAPPPLVLQASGTDILVLRAMPTDLTVWTTSAPIGTLKDHGDRLAVVDSNGQEIATTIP